MCLVNFDAIDSLLLDSMRRKIVEFPGLVADNESIEKKVCLTSCRRLESEKKGFYAFNVK